MSWLQEQLDAARREVATWPAWKRELLLRQINASSDPRWTCRYRHRCRENQSCNGKACMPVGERKTEGGG